MKSLLAAFAVFPLATASLVAATFYVAPRGSDANAGTLAAPFATVQHAQDLAAPGDTIFIRGGTYLVPADQIAAHVRNYAVITHLSKSGAPGHPINYFAYPGERPVFDCAEVKPPGYRVAAFRIDGSWVHLKGFDVIGVQVTIRTHTQSICFDNEGSHNVYEQLAAHDGKAIGFWIGHGSHNLVLNCDAYRNYDDVSENHRGGNVDGFGHHVPKGSGDNVFRGCRSWLNSDDGYDCINSAEAATFEDCWAFDNGYGTDFRSLGDGNGFKAGGYGATPAWRLPNPIPRHRVIDCVAVGNKANGFYANHHVGGVDFVHDSAYRNAINFNFLGRQMDNRTDIDGRGHNARDNLGFGARVAEVAHLDRQDGEYAHNTFDPSVTLSAADFESLDESQLERPRQSNGDLPVISFLHPIPGRAAAGFGAFR
ncbi:MAG TPA: right-handed parallel beta-helix repeat-containing protein [Opitutaceae bacterium]|nr:right-handed parallel beta-helix repeat-containing protein [Opitutaceae bacterium]